MLLKEEGNQAYKEGDYLKAAKLYRDALSTDTSNPVLYSNRAQCFLKLDDFSRALRDTVAGINLVGDDKKVMAKLYYRKGLAHRGLGDIHKSQYCFEKVLAMDPANGEAKEQLQQLHDLVKVELVDNLPPEFAQMMGSNVPPPVAPVLSLAAEEIAAMFPDKPQPSQPKIQEVPQPTPAPSPLQLLSHLKGLSPSQKLLGYDYVLGLGHDDLAMFSKGVDQSFLDFYMEAAGNHNVDPESVISSLQQLSAYPRYSLAMDMVDTVDRKNVLHKLDDPAAAKLLNLH